MFGGLRQLYESETSALLVTEVNYYAICSTVLEKKA